MAAVSVMMLPSASLRVGTAQRINLPQTLARRTGLVKALHVNHLVGNIGQESISSLIVEPHPGTP